MRLIDADAFVDEARSRIDMQDMYLPIHIKDMVLDEMPIVDALPVRHGEWLPIHHYIAGHEVVLGYICSECGNGALNAEGEDFLTDFCPNCGARMDEE